MSQVDNSLCLCLAPFFLICSVACLVLSVSLSNRNVAYENGIMTTGTIVDYRRSFNDRYIPQVAFMTVDGETVVFSDNRSNCHFGNAPQLGNQVSVSYLPSDPESAQNLNDGCALSARILQGASICCMLLAAISLCWPLLRSTSCCYRRSRSATASRTELTVNQRYERPVPGEEHQLTRHTPKVCQPRPANLVLSDALACCG
jgi:hypothetical protein